MYFNLNDVLLFVLLISFLMLWWNAQGAKQLALQAVRNHCKQVDVQLLDEVVALRGFWFKRNKRGSVVLWRRYEFEFTSTGNERYQGRIVLLGRMVEEIQLQPYRI
ncbi:MAG: hypothetical protein ACJAYG_001935 [Oceanicoccus sp.]|jgi:hypothetical protein